MKNKIIIALLVGVFFSSQVMAIEDAVSTQTEQDKPITLVEDVEYTNDVHSDFSLDDCIKIAIKNNLSIQSSTMTDYMYKEKIGEAWSNYFPELGLGMSFGRNREHAIGTYNTALMPRVSADMTIFDFGKTKATADSAKSTYQSKVLETEEHINVLIYNIKRAYYNLLFAQAQYLVYTDTVQDFELQKKQAFALYSAGKKAKVDVAIADYNLCKAKLNYEQAKKTLKVAKFELSRLMGFPEYSNYTLTSELKENVFGIDLEKAFAKAYEVRPELLAAQKAEEAARLTLRAKRRDFTPDLKVNASVGNDIGTYSMASYGFGANLSYNQFNIMKTKKQINQANYAYKKSQVDLADVKQELYLKINTAYENFMTAQESISIALNALEQAKEQYRQTTGRYKAGVADIIELKDGENAYLNARLDYYNSLLAYNVSLAEFEKEIGAPLDNYLSSTN